MACSIANTATTTNSTIVGWERGEVQPFREICGSQTRTKVWWKWSHSSMDAAAPAKLNDYKSFKIIRENRRESNDTIVSCMFLFAVTKS